LGIITSAVTASLYHTTIPRTQQLFYEQVLADPEEVLYNAIRRDRCLRHPSQPYVLYVRDVQGKRLIDVVIKRRLRKKDPATGAEVIVGYDFVARMHEARLRVDLQAGTMSLEPDRYAIDGNNTSILVNSSGQTFVQPLPDSVSGKEARQRISALTWEQLPERIAFMEAERDKTLALRDVQQAEIEKIQDPQVRLVAQSELRNYKFILDSQTRQVRNLRAEVFARPALAMSCLVFALVGCPVGVWANRADYLSTFIMCFIPTLIVYYPLLLIGTDFGKSGKIPLALGCWLADIVMGAIACFLIWRLLRR
jgi:lipopolysaccharide export system permease protein